MVVGDDVAVDAINELYCQTCGTKPKSPLVPKRILAKKCLP